VAGPLEGVRVVELAGIGPGPFAAAQLAALGADVLRVVRPGDPPSGADGLGSGRPVLPADLKDPAVTLLILNAVSVADVLLESFRPGVCERLGLGPQVCLSRNPRLVYARVTGWGQTGPRAGEVGHDINYLSLTGALHAIGAAGGPPVPPLNLLADFAGGSMFAVTGVLAALFARQATGTGQVVDVAMVDGVSALLTMVWGMFSAGAWRDERGANLLDGGAPFYTVYRCADDRYVAVGALEESFYAALLAGLELPDLPPRDGPENWPALRERFAAAFLSRPRADWLERFSASPACVTPVLSLTEARRDPHLRARGTLVDTPDGVGPAPAPRFSADPARAGRDPISGAELLARWGVSS
jgi:alpha-methylacyl-CoA racemase